MTLTDTQYDDSELVSGLLQRMPEALEKLHARYRILLKSIIMQVLHDDNEADDVLQDVLLQVWNRVESYSAEKGKLASWLCTLARRRAIDRLRQHAAYQRATDRFEISCNHPDKSIDERQTVETEANLDDVRLLLDSHLASLPPPQQKVIRLAFYENKSQREISALTHTPLGTVKTRIELGLKKLSQSFSGLRAKVV